MYFALPSFIFLPRQTFVFLKFGCEAYHQDQEVMQIRASDNANQTNAIYDNGLQTCVITEGSITSRPPTCDSNFGKSGIPIQLTKVIK